MTNPRTTGRSVDMAYLAAPIDDPTTLELDLRAVRETATRALVQHGVSVFRPDQAFALREQTSPHVSKINTLALRTCDLLVVLWPGAIRSVGVPLEIQEAISSNKDILLVHDGWADTSWSAAGWSTYSRLRLHFVDRFEVSNVFNAIVDYFKETPS